MISFDLAKKLKNAGLKWEPKLGDFYVADYGNGLGPTKIKVVSSDNFGVPDDTLIWLPRLDQLLAEIEKLGHWWMLNIGGVRIRHADTSEVEVAEVLLWILEREAKRNGGKS